MTTTTTTTSPHSISSSSPSINAYPHPPVHSPHTYTSSPPSLANAWPIKSATVTHPPAVTQVKSPAQSNSPISSAWSPPTQIPSPASPPPKSVPIEKHLYTELRALLQTEGCVLSCEVNEKIPAMRDYLKHGEKKLKDFIQAHSEFEMFCPVPGKHHTAVRFSGSSQMPKPRQRSSSGHTNSPTLSASSSPVSPIQFVSDGMGMMMLNGDHREFEEVLEQVRLAIQGNDANTLKRLLHQYPKLVSVHVDSDGMTILHYAVFFNPDLVEMILSAGALVNARTSKLVTPLHIAARDSPSCVRTLLAAGADPNLQDQIGFTALHWAVVYHPELMRPLVAAGANHIIRAHDGVDCLDLAHKVAPETFEELTLILAQNTPITPITTPFTSFNDMSFDVSQFTGVVTEAFPTYAVIDQYCVATQPACSVWPLRLGDRVTVTAVKAENTWKALSVQPDTSVPATDPILTGAGINLFETQQLPTFFPGSLFLCSSCGSPTDHPYQSSCGHSLCATCFSRGNCITCSLHLTQIECQTPDCGNAVPLALNDLMSHTFCGKCNNSRCMVCGEIPRNPLDTCRAATNYTAAVNVNGTDTGLMFADPMWGLDRR
eukprot:c4183_g1_i1.p1 GENE.c4183_g1_i1~~c4183_g1_i1.p1  ORF type:complete len:625 (-),score=152.48 c4183_g1_i1:141-1943(-)